MRFFVLLISIILPSFASAAEDCLSTEQRVGATYGTAEFVGAPWVHTWTDSNQSDAPGHQIKAVVGDETIIYGVSNAVDMNGVWFDNLGTLSRGLGYGPYSATRLRDGSIQIYGTNCSSWIVRHNQPSEPVPVAGYGPIDEPDVLACVADESIIEYIELKLNSGHNENPLGDKSLFATYGAGRYVTGFDTWGTQVLVNIDNLDDQGCSASYF